MTTGEMEEVIRCSFCGNNNKEVKVMIRGPNVFICNECIDICVEILEEKGHRSKSLNAPPEIDYQALGIKPRFNKLKFALRDNHCFYLCPFSEPFNTIYSDHAHKALTGEGFTVERADEVF